MDKPKRSNPRSRSLEIKNYRGDNESKAYQHGICIRSMQNGIGKIQTNQKICYQPTACNLNIQC